MILPSFLHGLGAMREQPGTQREIQNNILPAWLQGFCILGERVKGWKGEGILGCKGPGGQGPWIMGDHEKGGIMAWIPYIVSKGNPSLNPVFQKEILSRFPYFSMTS